MEDKTEMRHKVMVIGLDGGDPHLIEKWADEGKLPNLSKIMDGGIHGILKSTIPVVSPCAWASFMTGKNPGKHGIFGFWIHDEARGHLRIVNSNDIERPIWHLLSAVGKKVGVVNIPMTYPPKKINGFMITAFLTPPSSNNFTYPPELKDEIGEYKIDIKFEKYAFIPHHTNIRNDEFLGELYDVTEKRKRVILNLMNRFDWDFFISSFKGPDSVQHLFWHYMDPAHPRHDPEEAKRHGDAILKYYQKIDEIIGEMLGKIDDDTTVIIMSDHGGRLSDYHPIKYVYVNDWLRRLGLLRLKRRRIERFLFRFLVIGRGIIRWVSRLSPTKFARFIPDKLKEVMRGLSFIDFSKTKAQLYGQGIKINLNSDELEHGVEFREKYEDLREFIIHGLRLLRDPETGDGVIEEIYKREDLYSGRYVNRAPDIVFLTKPGYGSNSSIGNASLIELAPQSRITGGHGRDGVLLMWGKDVKKGRRINADIIDLAPTILHILDVPIPLDIDGKVLREAFKASSDLSSKSIQYERLIKREERPMFEWSEMEEEEIKKRLRGLGYL